jgi:hypothetical protein
MVRRIKELSGLRDTKTMNSTKKRSIPRVQSSAYLDLYILQKGRGRLEKEMCILDKRKKSIQKRLDEIDAEMIKIEKAEAKKRQVNPKGFKKSPAKDWKTMAVKY